MKGIIFEIFTIQIKINYSYHQRSITLIIKDQLLSLDVIIFVIKYYKKHEIEIQLNTEEFIQSLVLKKIFKSISF